MILRLDESSSTTAWNGSVSRSFGIESMQVTKAPLGALTVFNLPRTTPQIFILVAGDAPVDHHGLPRYSSVTGSVQFRQAPPSPHCSAIR